MNTSRKSINNKINNKVKKEVVKVLKQDAQINNNNRRRFRRRNNFNTRIMRNQLGIRPTIQANRIKFQTINSRRAGEVIATNTETIGVANRGMNYFKFTPGNSGALVLDKLAGIYDLYTVRTLIFHCKSSVGSLTNGQYRFAVDYNGSLPTTAQQIEAMTNSKIDNIYKNSSIVTKPNSLNKVKKYSTYDESNPTQNQFENTACTLCIYIDESVEVMPAITIQVQYTVHFYTVKTVNLASNPTATSVSQIVQVPSNPQITPSVILSQDDAPDILNTSAFSPSENATIDSFSTPDKTQGAQYTFAMTQGNTTPSVRLRNAQTGDLIPESEYVIKNANLANLKIKNKRNRKFLQYNDLLSINNIQADPITVIVGIIEFVSSLVSIAQLVIDIVRPSVPEGLNIQAEAAELLDSISAVSLGPGIDILLPDPQNQDVFDNINFSTSAIGLFDNSTPTQYLMSYNNNGQASLTLSRMEVEVYDTTNDPIDQTFALSNTNNVVRPFRYLDDTNKAECTFHLFFTDSTNLLKIGQVYNFNTSVGFITGAQTTHPIGSLLLPSETRSKTENVIVYNQSIGSYNQQFSIVQESNASQFYVFSVRVSDNVLAEMLMGSTEGADIITNFYNFSISDAAEVNREIVQVNVPSSITSQSKQKFNSRSLKFKLKDLKNKFSKNSLEDFEEVDASIETIG